MASYAIYKTFFFFFDNQSYSRSHVEICCRAGICGVNQYYNKIHCLFNCDFNVDNKIHTSFGTCINTACLSLSFISLASGRGMVLCSGVSPAPLPLPWSRTISSLTWRPARSFLKGCFWMRVFHLLLPKVFLYLFIFFFELVTHSAFDECPCPCFSLKMTSAVKR